MPYPASRPRTQKSPRKRPQPFGCSAKPNPSPLEASLPPTWPRSSRCWRPSFSCSIDTPAGVLYWRRGWPTVRLRPFLLEPMTKLSLPEVTIYTDGGADPNPGTGGWAAILIDAATGKAREISGGEPHATNNRMELTAAIRALEALKRRCRVHLFTDSLYLRKGITEWLPGWTARGWRRKAGELQNEDLWRRLAEMVESHEVHWDWVRGHAGNQWNERADELATQEIRKRRGGRIAAPASAAEVYLRVSCAGGRGGWAAL